jgi:uncharacterized protein (DUF1684 family)
MQEITQYRAEQDTFFRFDPASPFRRDTTITYTGIKWFEPDLGFRFESRLFRYDRPDTVSIFGTKGEERKSIRYGWFELEYGEKTYKLNVYKSREKDIRKPEMRNYLNVWFTDRTTDKESYHVGRYVDIGSEENDPAHIYTIDFNKAYSPYCSYSPLYSCAIPTKDDYLDFSIYAGEKRYNP